jgi:hypothetical protein
VVLSRRCCEMTQMQDFLRGLTFYHWWPSTLNPTRSV